MISVRQISTKSLAVSTYIVLAALCAVAYFRWNLPKAEVPFAFGVALLLPFAFKNLLGNGFSPAAVLAMLVCIFIQLAFLQFFPSGGKASLFAFIVYLASTACLRLSADQDARSVIVLSCALAAIELFTTFGFIIAIILAPLYAGLSFASADIRQRGGLCTLLIFIPLAAAATFYFLPDDPWLARQGMPGQQPLKLPIYLFFIALSVFTTAPMLVMTMTVNRLRSASGFMILATAIAICLVFTVEVAAYARHTLSFVIATLIGGSLAIASTWRPTVRNTELAIASAALGVVLTGWLMAVVRQFA